MKSSKSSQQQSTSQTDARQVVDNGSFGNTGAASAFGGTMAVSGSNNVINTIDAGLIESAFSYLKDRDVSGSAQVASILDTSRNALEVVAKSQNPNMNNAMLWALAGVSALVLLKA